MSPRIGREMLRRGCIQERPVIEVVGMGEAPPLVIPEVERTQESKIRRKDVKKMVGSVSEGGVDGCPASDICGLAAIRWD